MNQTIQVVIPMSGLGQRFLDAGYKEIKPLIRVNDTPIIERLLEKIPANWPCTFILSSAQKDSSLPAVLAKLRPQGKIHYIEPHKKGPGWALQQALPSLEKNQPVLVSYCDFGMIWDPWDFKKYVEITQCDSCVICYRGFHAHYLSPTTYAFCRMENDQVKEIKEKGSFTSNRENEPASAGMYYFRSTQILESALSFQFKNSLFHKDESYTSLTVQALLQENPKSNVKIYEIPYFFQWGTPEDLQNYEYWERGWNAYLQAPPQVKSSESVATLIPMAGLGSRFKNHTATPKPLIQIGHQRMFEWATQSLPPTSSLNFITTEKIAEELPGDIVQKSILLRETPQGQALTTLSSLEKLALKKKSILISSCDHLALFSSQNWQNLIQSTDIDAAIMTIRGFPGCQRSPNSFAYVQSEKTGAAFEKIQKISVKKPLSNTPSKDQLLVGTFWFKDTEVLIPLIKELVQKNKSVNNEFYLDSVFDLYLEKDKKVVSFELDTYMNMGDPDSLAEFLYWKEVFTSQKTVPRQRLEFLFGDRK